MEAKYTPGPWKFHEQGDANDYVLLTNERRWVMSFRQNGEIWTDEQIANARLIAAAPDLFDVVHAIINLVEKGWAPNEILDMHSPLMHAACTAHAKATGSAA